MFLVVTSFIKKRSSKPQSNGKLLSDISKNPKHPTKPQITHMHHPGLELELSGKKIPRNVSTDFGITVM